MSKELTFYEAVADFSSFQAMTSAIGALETLGIAPFDITPSSDAPVPSTSVYYLSACFTDATLFEPIRMALRDHGARDIDIQDMA
jgi:hypothetical protein